MKLLPYKIGRFLGWFLIIGALAAYALKYPDYSTYIFSRDLLYFHLAIGAYLDLLYHFIKLDQKFKDLKK